MEKTYTKPYLLLAFYQYIPINDAELFATSHLKYCKLNGIQGRIIVADEGINGTVSGLVENCLSYISHLNDELGFDIDFKIDEIDEHKFIKTHVRFKDEIVHSGLKDIVKPHIKTGKHLNGKAFQKLKEEDDVVILDVRSNYEHGIGKFKNALTLDIDNFRDFPEKIKELEHLKNKKVITYCTGGIKCEKASAYLLENGFKDVYQLHGGIIKYAKETGGKDFEGQCYVFDGRIVVDVNIVNPTIISTCYTCNTSTFRMVNCANPECNNHIPMCESCSEEMDGACSEACKTHPRKREYNGTGYYVKANPTL